MLQTLIQFIQLRLSMTSNERGATAVEYGLMVSLIAVVIIAAVTTLGGNLSEMFESVAGEISSFVPGD